MTRPRLPALLSEAIRPANMLVIVLFVVVVAGALVVGP